MENYLGLSIGASIISLALIGVTSALNRIADEFKRFNDNHSTK